MRIPYNWLEEWVYPLAPPGELAERLTMAGLEVEAAERVGEETVLIGKVTPNRGDWLSIRGVAREVAAIYNTGITPQELSPPQEGSSQTEDLAQVIVEEEELCPRYSARVVEGLQVRESPPWLRKRILSVGVRPVNNVVDATNYVLMEIGQPLHAFDLDRLREARIIVRRASKGETLTTLDGEERALSTEDLVIADGKGPVALAGVMGGSETEVGQGTWRILLESAHFAPFSVRRTARAQGMQTEASYRFERWVDPEGTVEALNRVTRLIIETAGGEVGQGAIDVYPTAIAPIEVLLRPAKANALLGIRMRADRMAEVFRRLGFSVEGRKPLTVRVPTFRRDISREEDLIEELARLTGYEEIPTEVPPGLAEIATQSPELRLLEKAREVLKQCGLAEVVTFSLTRPGMGMGTGGNGDWITLSNPLVEEFSRLRTSLLPSLLGTLARNLEHGVRDVNVFEVGKVYQQRSDGDCSEKWMAAILLSGQRSSTSLGSCRSDFHQVKGIVEAVLREFGVSPGVVQKEQELFYAEGRSGMAMVGDEMLAHYGQVAGSLLEGLDIPQAAFYAEIDLGLLAEAQEQNEQRKGAGSVQYSPIPRFPAVRRDLAVEVPEEMAFADLERMVRGNSDELLVEVGVFDVYRGRQVPPGKKSLALRLDFQAPDRTLRDEEVGERIESIINGLEGHANIRVRRQQVG